MNENINAILEAYKTGETTLAETNAALAAAGANIRLDPGKNAKGGWTEAEMAEGFTPGEPAAPVPDKPDMSRCAALAGETVIQETAGGRYAVSYNDEGYATLAKKL